MFNDVTKFLIPFFSLEQERQAVLNAAFVHNEMLLGKINYAGSASEFVPRLIRVLQHHGEISPGTQALWQLLLTIKDQIGLDKQEQIDTFYAWANTPHAVTLQRGDVIEGTSRPTLIMLVLILLAVLTLAAFNLISPSQQAVLLANLGLTTLTPPPSPTPSLESYDVGLAVAYFAVPDDGSVSPEEADTLVEQVYARMEDELNDFSSAIDLTIGFIPPSTIGRIQGITSTERGESAADIARRYGADMVLYGKITLNSFNRLEVQPEFYIRPDKFVEALEITGAYRLGSEIEVEGPLSFIRNAMKVNRPLSTRTAAAAQIFTGLSFYVLEDYKEAYKTFEKIMDLPEWNAVDGKEVLYVLLGNTQARLAAQATQNGDLEISLTYIDKALNWYAQAIELAPDYSRAYTGRASALYIQWSINTQLTDQSDLFQLKQVLETLDQASDVLDQPHEVSIETKKLFARAQADFWLYTLHRQDLPAEEAEGIHQEFMAVTQQIIKRYENGGQPTLREITSETYALIGNMSRNEEHCELAIEAFDTAIDLSYSSQRQMFFYGWIGDCYTSLQQPEHAYDAYTVAIQLADETQASESQKKSYRTKRSALREGHN